MIEYDELNRFVDWYQTKIAEESLRIARLLAKNVKDGDLDNIGSEESLYVIRELYWSIPEIEITMLWVTFGKPKGFMDINMARFIDLECSMDKCDETVSVYMKDRNDRDRWSKMGVLCEDCKATLVAIELKELEDLDRNRANEFAESEIARLRSLPYAEYLQSEHWQTIRLEVLKRDGDHCRVCNSEDRLEVHHRTYERLGCEDLEDLMTLCHDCHETFHKNGRLAKPK
jgi:hypothetical protein